MSSLSFNLLLIKCPR